MNPNRLPFFTVVLVMLLASSFAFASTTRSDTGRSPTRHFDLVNATFDSVTALAIAPTGYDVFRDIVLGQPLQGGLTSMTFDVPAGGCLRDLRITFLGGRTQLFPRVDVCRSGGLRLASNTRSTRPPAV